VNIIGYAQSCGGPSSGWNVAVSLCGPSKRAVVADVRVIVPDTEPVRDEAHPVRRTAQIAKPTTGSRVMEL
jgi:hypothetical protein